MDKNLLYDIFFSLLGEQPEQQKKLFFKSIFKKIKT